ncbi:45748_t:CDS:1, partial [Gigaspora margarita]
DNSTVPNMKSSRNLYDVKSDEENLSNLQVGTNKANIDSNISEKIGVTILIQEKILQE